MRSDVSDISQKIDVNEQMKKEEFVKMADDHIKDMDKQIAEARKACAPKPWIE